VSDAESAHFGYRELALGIQMTATPQAAGGGAAQRLRRCPRFKQSVVATVIGGNDGVNPVARTDPASPIAGRSWARTAIMIQRCSSPGFAGIPNPLFAADDTLMNVADGRAAVEANISAIKEAA